MKYAQLPEGYDDSIKLQKILHETDEAMLLQQGKQRAFDLFHQMAQRVPAYKDFLQKNGLNPHDIQTLDDLARVPTISKDNYLRQYPRSMLVWDGDFGSGQWLISTTSGSTGKPFYFPRQSLQNQQYAITAELYLRTNFSIQTKKTLYIVAYPMGAWIGGVFTYEALKIVADKGLYNLSIITPGIHKQEVINAILELKDDFDQILIGAYAPFLKDILDDGTSQGIDWAALDIGFIFSAEGFSETFRDYVLGKTQPQDYLKATLNHYGTVDMGTMAHETPESILIRRQLAQQDELKILFPENSRQPTFCQYDPNLFYFEVENDSLLCTAYSGIPLVRYDLKDYGGVITRQAVHQRLAEQGMNVADWLADENISDISWNLPFVYLYERNDFSVSYYAFLIYPDMIRRALLSEVLHPDVTGKFTMYVDYNLTGRQQLHIHIEKKAAVQTTHDLTTIIKEIVNEALLAQSSEYNETIKIVGADALPHIRLHEYEDPHYFRPGGKQKWIKN